MYYNLLFVGLANKLEIPAEGNDVLNVFCYLMYFLFLYKVCLATIYLKVILIC